MKKMKKKPPVSNGTTIVYNYEYGLHHLYSDDYCIVAVVTNDNITLSSTLVSIVFKSYPTKSFFVA